MTLIQNLEFLALIILLAPFSLAYYLLKRNKTIFPILPGAIFLLFSYLSTNLENVVAPEEFNFLTHFFLMLSGIFFLLGIIYMFYKTESQKKIKISEKGRG